MRSDNNILNELQSLSPFLTSVSNKNIFSVPEGYFDTLSDAIVIRSKDELIIPAEAETFKVPAGYFDNLSTVLLDKVKAIPTDAEASKELKTLSPFLFNLQQVQTFTAPPQYFTELPVNIVKQLNPPSAKIVNIINFRKILKYAAAAVLIGAISLSVYKYAKYPFSPTATAIVSASLTPATEKGKQMNDQQFNEGMQVLSNEDISTYLEKNGSEEDISFITPNLKEEDLPNKDAYFLDEKTLENYLGLTDAKN